MPQVTAQKSTQISYCYNKKKAKQQNGILFDPFFTSQIHFLCRIKDTSKWYIIILSCCTIYPVLITMNKFRGSDFWVYVLTAV